jgi:glycosyltransferase involved in cell wall biosynthesis
MSRKLKVLHCPLNNGNNAWVLSRAERKLGLASDLVIFKKHPFFEDYDRYLKIESITIPNEIKRIAFLKEALRNYDIFHFNFGQSIWDHPFWGLNHLDFPIIKKYKKKIIVTFQGDDARRKDYFLNKYGFGPYDKQDYTLLDKFFDRMRAIRIGQVEKYADKIFALNPDIMSILPKRTEFLPYSSIDVDEVKPIYPARTSRKIKIIHAPSERIKKGTEIIVSIIKKLSLKYPLEWVLVENLPRKRAWEIYQKADIAIDQIIIGWYGAFAVEMMALGKPVIAYLRSSDIQAFVPFYKDIPIVNADPQTLEESLIMLIENYHLRNKIAKQSRKFVQKYHHPLKIAQKTKKIYEDLCAG